MVTHVASQLVLRYLGIASKMKSRWLMIGLTLSEH